MNLQTLLSEKIKQLPTELHDTTSVFCSDLSARLSESEIQTLTTPALGDAFLKVCVSSRFVADIVFRDPALLMDRIHSGALFSSVWRQNYKLSLVDQTAISEAELAKQLRQLRRREMLRIAWRDLAGWADLDETLLDLTQLAEYCIQTALNFAYQTACSRWGTPTLSNGRTFNLVVLGMGKLGGKELNFSSDIDLIFAFAEEGTLPSAKQLSYGEFFTRICQTLIKLLDEITVDGFVFRTDTRLRPFGESGALIMSFAGMENYYQTQAREWERYAMLKARQVAGDSESGAQLAALIQPFVYRRYLDYGTFEELRGLKFQIMQELKRKDKQDNIKLGPGGIREVEFIGQAFQLIRGGKDARLQCREIQTVLQVLAEQKLMTDEVVKQLITGYRFLRRVENHIQQFQDKQTHDLPAQALQQLILAWSMNYADWTDFLQTLNQHRNAIHTVFEEVFSLNLHDSKQKQANLLWLSQVDDVATQKILHDLGFANPISTLEALQTFKSSPAIKRLSSKGLKVMQDLIPKLLRALQVIPQPEVAFTRILKLFTLVAGRNVYLSLLAENPAALQELIQLCAASPWIGEYLAQYPLLFDELINKGALYAPLQKQALQQELDRELSKTPLLDEEQLLFKLRQFKHVNVLRVAAADLMAYIPVTTVSDYLSWIAETILEQVLIFAWQTLRAVHGVPAGTDALVNQFAIIAYGKLGGSELGYHSDLDLVFLHCYSDENALTDGVKRISAGHFYLRLGQKIRQILQTKLLAGELYAVDLRLRPNGDAGLVVSQVDYYANYLRKNAWTFEHQALVRARFITGDSRLEQQFKQIRCEILCQVRDYTVLKKEVHDMRQKMHDNLISKSSKGVDLKLAQGGMVDIEFLVQFAVLATANQQPDLCLYTANIYLLEQLKAQGFFTVSAAQLLYQAYCVYRDYNHHLILQGLNNLADDQQFSLQRAEVSRIWSIYME